MKCPVCKNSQIQTKMELVIREKYPSTLLVCQACGLHFFQNSDRWLSEAYENSINLSDTGILVRNLDFARLTFSVLFWLRRLSFLGLDSAGGYGVFVRLMRDAGVSFYWSDLYTQNIFARGFEEAKMESNPGIVTAFEVLEHLTEPQQYLARLFQKSDLVLVSTHLVPANGITDDWWYLGLHHGQHIQFHTTESLKVLAGQVGAHVVSCGSLHLFSKKWIPRGFFLVMIRSARLIWGLRRLFLKSLVGPDSEALGAKGRI